MGRAERVVEKMRETSLLYLFFPSVLGHEYFPGKCPKYTPMEGFEWDKFSSGVWYVTQKYNTKSTCLTYEFGSDGSGIKTVKQDRRLPFSDKIDVDNTYRYKGKLVTPNEDNPADMLVTFPLNPIGEAFFVVMQTDYTSHALVCTCQESSLLLIASFNRRSCSILQRKPEEDPSVTEELKAFLDADVHEEGCEDSSHDFEEINHSNCNYEEDKGITIDVEKILGIGGQAANQVRDAVETLANEFEFKSEKQIQEEAEAEVNEVYDEIHGDSHEDSHDHSHEHDHDHDHEHDHN